jgi:hypothetical protein
LELELKISNEERANQNKLIRKTKEELNDTIRDKAALLATIE